MDTPSMTSTAPTPESTQHYSLVAIILHWTISVSIFIMLGLGVALEYINSKALASNLMFIHKSLGLTILLLVVTRIIWRLTHTPPSLPEKISTGEKILAKADHFLFDNYSRT